MASRVFPPHWWPALLAGSPALVPLLWLRHRSYKKARARAGEANRQRLDSARRLDLPVLESLALTVLVEQQTELGFHGDSGVSYLFRTDRGAVLFDVGYGPATDSLAHNAQRLGVTLDGVEALVISHLHLDHMGGLKAQRAREVAVPVELGATKGMPCVLPDEAMAPGFSAEVVRQPRLLPAGLATTGPLSRSLFAYGLMEEQALIARVEGKGLVVITGCGHPTVELILSMVRRLSDEPLYALIGGLHFPITGSRSKPLGLQLQMIAGTGKPPWARVTDDDLSNAIAAINDAAPARVLISAHDSCDHALSRFADELDAEIEVLRAGATYELGASDPSTR